MAGRHATQEFSSVGDLELKGLPDPVPSVAQRARITIPEYRKSKRTVAATQTPVTSTLCGRAQPPAPKLAIGTIR
jgi:hypothetical protein